MTIPIDSNSLNTGTRQILQTNHPPPDHEFEPSPNQLCQIRFSSWVRFGETTHPTFFTSTGMSSANSACLFQELLLFCQEQTKDQCAPVGMTFLPLLWSIVHKYAFVNRSLDSLGYVFCLHGIFHQKFSKSRVQHTFLHPPL